MIITRHPSGSNDWVLWRNPVAVITTSDINEIKSGLLRIEHHVHQGLMALGFLAYEAGQAFDSNFSNKRNDDGVPLLWFAIFTGHEPYDPPTKQATPHIHWKPSVNHRSYRQSVHAIKKRIAAGDTYQVNYTFPLISRNSTNLRALFFQLADHQPTPYAMFIALFSHLMPIQSAPGKTFCWLSTNRSPA